MSSYYQKRLTIVKNSTQQTESSKSWTVCCDMLDDQWLVRPQIYRRAFLTTSWLPKSVPNTHSRLHLSPTKKLWTLYSGETSGFWLSKDLNSNVVFGLTYNSTSSCFRYQNKSRSCEQESDFWPPADSWPTDYCQLRSTILITTLRIFLSDRRIYPSTLYNVFTTCASNNVTNWVNWFRNPQQLAAWFKHNGSANKSPRSCILRIQLMWRGYWFRDFFVCCVTRASQLDAGMQNRTTWGSPFVHGSPQQDKFLGV